MSSLLEHRHKICPLAETMLSFPTEKGGKFSFLLRCWGTCHSPGKRSGARGGWRNIYHPVNRWRSVNAAMEWNIAIRPELKWRVTMCLLAPSELGWAAVEAKQNSVSFAALYRKPKHGEGRELPEVAGSPELVGSPELAVPPLKMQLGPHLLVVGVGSHGAGWDAVPLWPSPAPCKLGGQRELTREFSSLRSQVFEWAKAAGEGKGTVPAHLQKSAKLGVKTRSSSVLFICAAFGFEGTCSLQGSQNEKLLH